MAPSTLFLSTAAALVAAVAVNAQAQSTFPATPLASKTGFSYPSNIPDKVDTEPNLIRGSQFGYNKCNSTTEGKDSLCQTSFLNALDDFCLWAPPKPDSLIADTEGEEVAWCTKPGRGTRLFPQGALQGVQFMRTSDYVQVVGFVDQTQINIQSGDFGGELDPHGADLRGNPLGGLVFSNAWSSGNNDSFTQVVEWHNFMGGNAFCFKVCDPTKPNAAKFCEHIYDRIGCAFNAPNAAKNGTFETCDGEVQDFPGVYTENGQTMTFTQPPEGVVPTPPYTPRVPASSNCVQHNSAELFNAIATVLPTTGVFASGGASFSAAQSAASAAASTASGAKASSSSAPNDASALAVGGLSMILGVVGSMLFLS